MASGTRRIFAMIQLVNEGTSSKQIVKIKIETWFLKLYLQKMKESMRTIYVWIEPIHLNLLGLGNGHGTYLGRFHDQYLKTHCRLW